MTENIQPSPEIETVDRRHFLRNGLALAGGVAVWGALRFGSDAVHGLVDLSREGDDHDRTTEVFHDGVTNYWHKLSIYTGLLQIDPSVRVATDIFGKPDDAHWPDSRYIVAVRPIAVKGSLLRNIADSNQGTQDRVDRVIRDISPNLFAVWHPQKAQLLYFDNTANAGLITPLTQRGYFGVDRLPIDEVTIDGREARGQTLYPYQRDDPEVIFKPDEYEQQKLNQLQGDQIAYQTELDEAHKSQYNYQATERHRFFGLVGAIDTFDQLNSVVNNFYDGNDPFVLTKP